MSTATWLCLALALAYGAALVADPAATLLAFALLSLLALGRVGLGVLAFALAALALGGARAELALTSYDHDRARLLSTLPASLRCDLTGRVARAPTANAKGGVAVLAVESARCESVALPLPVSVRLYAMPDGLRRGDTLSVRAELGILRSFRNKGMSRPELRSAGDPILLSGVAERALVLDQGKGLTAQIDRLRAHVRRRIRATFAPAAVGLARALVLGESDLDPSDAQAFKLSGLAHILAVSGTHLVFAVVSLVNALKFVLVRLEGIAARCDVSRAATAVGVVLALLYADFAGGSGSAWRAAWMLAAAFGVHAAGRRPSGVRSLALALIVGAAVDPLVAFDISFELSIAATCGLMFVAQPVSRACVNLRFAFVRYLVTSAAASMAAILCCAPLLAMLSGRITLAGLIANLVAGPLGETLALPLCLLHTVTAGLPGFERGIAEVASGALLVIRRIAHLAADATWLAVDIAPPSAWQLAVLAVSAGGALLVARSAARAGLRRTLWLSAGALAISGVELALKRAGAPLGELRVTALDVDQGDSTLIDLPDGRALLVDAGGVVGGGLDPGAAAVVPTLRARRRARLDVIVLSHPHPDHFGGLLAVIDAVDVGELWDTGQGRLEGAGPVYQALLEKLRARRIPIREPAELCDRPRRFGAATVTVLAPCPSFTPHVDANDNSIVLRVELGSRAALLTGDAELSEEADLTLQRRHMLRADLLKTGHHGSRTSSNSEFLAAVAPKLALISCGARNRFGHPHAEALDRLASAGARVLRTDRLGSIGWHTDGDRQWLDTYAARGD